jgi:septation ring formation regulator EzrA
MTSVSPRSSAAQHVKRVQDGLKEHERETSKVVDQLQEKRQQRIKARRRLAGLSTAEIMAAPYQEGA